MDKQLKELALRARAELTAADSLERLRQLEVSYLGRKGEVTSILRSLGSLPPEQRPVIGQHANQLRRELAELLQDRAEQLQAQDASRARREQALDVTLPGVAFRAGRVHPLMRVWRDVERIFVGMGFEVVEGNEVETDYFNFEALNVPKDHPARDMQDSFYLAEDIVLRTQTSPVQIRMMRTLAPKLPVRLVHPGRTYRRGDDDFTHSPMFHQMECLYVDKGIGLQRNCCFEVYSF